MDACLSFVSLCIVLYATVSSPTQGFYRGCVGFIVPIILSRHRAQSAMYKWISKPIILLLFLLSRSGPFDPLHFIIPTITVLHGSRGSAICKATSYGLDDWGVGVRVPVGSRIFLFSKSSRPALGSTQPPTLWVPGALSRGKAAGAWSWPLTSNSCRGQENVDLYINSPIRLHGVVLKIRWAQGQLCLLTVLYTRILGRIHWTGYDPTDKASTYTGQRIIEHDSNPRFQVFVLSKTVRDFESSTTVASKNLTQLNDTEHFTMNS
jgi:hypothetical protein